MESQHGNLTRCLRGRGGMVDATDLGKLGLGGETCQVDALKLRETYL